jgi:hypothetical protein
MENPVNLPPEIDFQSLHRSDYITPRRPRDDPRPARRPGLTLCHANIPKCNGCSLVLPHRQEQDTSIPVSSGSWRDQNGPCPT